MAQPSGQAGRKVGYSVNGSAEINSIPPALPAKAHRRSKAGEAIKPTGGKDRYKAPLDNPKYVRDLIAMVTHDLRTPLTSIHGMLSLLRLGACGELPEKALEAILIAERGSRRLLKMVDDLLDIEMLESSKPSIRYSLTSCATIIQKSVDALIGFADKHSIKIEVPTQSIEVNADEDRLVQVLVNLLSNAVKFSPDGSTISIEVAKADECVEFRVIDQGPGIDEEDRYCLFERFNQVQAVNSTKLSGTGLGLAICRAIVHAHHGEIGYETQVGKGSSFWFRIPDLRQ
ncbi:MAG TPA: HAMP domain-containing sensor histidine kinase [Candidatus Obscuribacterales bacterium]